MHSVLRPNYRRARALALEIGPLASIWTRREVIFIHPRRHRGFEGRTTSLGARVLANRRDFGV